MKVKIILQDNLKEKIGSQTIKIPIREQETIDTLLIKLSRRNPNLVESILDPRTGNVKDGFDIELNGRSIKQIKGLHTRLKDKDEVTVSQNSA